MHGINCIWSWQITFIIYYRILSVNILLRTFCSLLIMDTVFNVHEMCLSGFSMGAVQSSWNEVRCILPHKLLCFPEVCVEVLLFNPEMSDRFPQREQFSLWEGLHCQIHRHKVVFITLSLSFKYLSDIFSYVFFFILNIGNLYFFFVRMIIW